MEDVGEDVEVFIGANELCDSGTEELDDTQAVVWGSVDKVADLEQFQHNRLAFVLLRVEASLQPHVLSSSLGTVFFH
jgi:hypothetical protein